MQLQRLPMMMVVALGLNLWVVADALPLALAMSGDGGEGPALLLLSLLVPAALAIGVWQRGAIALFVAVPLFVALPLCLTGAEASARVLPALAFVPQALSLVAYLLAVAHALVRGEQGQAAATPVTTMRSLRQDLLPARWLRRLRVYRGLVATAVIFPAVLLAAVDLSPSFARALGASFGPRAARVQALVTVGVGALWVGILRAYLLAPLHAHLQHDRDLLAAIEADRRHARRGRPRAAFYVAVIVALVAMAAVVWQRAR
jgi:hypothetical protein